MIEQFIARPYVPPVLTAIVVGAGFVVAFW
jgi:hypothetical protein